MTLEELQNSDRILFECRAGSFAYGTNTEKSDIDIKGIFLQTPAELITLEEIPKQINDDNNDISYYSLRRYLELAADANPNILELLFMPDECILKSSEIYQKLLSFRSEFITEKCLETHQAYALAQIKKARGRNKWINNPQPETKPAPDNFCYFISSQNDSKFPARPVKLNETKLEISSLKVSSVEHCPGLYRVYKSASEVQLFVNETINCSSIPVEEELANFCGLLYYNEDAFKRACTDHKNYWDWTRKRNPERWKLQEKGEIDYDPKNMQHTLRLLFTAKTILSDGYIPVRFSGEKLTLLRDIREGRYNYRELIEMAETVNSEIDSLKLSVKLNPPMSARRSSEILFELMGVK